VLIMLGCMNISLGGHDDLFGSSGSSDSGVFAQEGKVSLLPSGEQVVYYPVPYASTPNLELDDSLHACEIVEQSATCFRVRIRSGINTNMQSVTWKARGVRAPAPTAQPVSTSAPPSASAGAPASAPTGLPAAPVPTSVSH
jgi:hypothetical protein